MSTYSDEYSLSHLGINGDFSIKKISKELNKGQFIQVICEGYGFVAIRKTEKDEILFALPKYDADVLWVSEYELKNQIILE